MKDNVIEEVILVSVGYPHDYDYTKIRVRDLVEKPDDYLHFICDNLMPYLVEQYSVDKQLLTLTGHSYSGYWAFYSLFHSDINGTKK
jgi:enterochelin esterase-like enzyme